MVSMLSLLKNIMTILYNCKPERILDLGCGTGGHALVLARRGYRITGVDRSASMLEIARRKAKEVGRRE